MRKISQEARDAFLNFYEYRNGNTQVEVLNNGDALLLLHGNVIAKRDMWGDLHITLAEWPTVTTRERLNALPGVHVTQRDHEQYLNGEKWGGEWRMV